MSQAKVDRYKEEKANRKKTIAKEKMLRRVKMAVGVLVAAVIVGWAGFSGYRVYENNLHESFCNRRLYDNFGYRGIRSEGCSAKRGSPSFMEKSYSFAALSAFESALSIACNNTIEVYWLSV